MNSMIEKRINFTIITFDVYKGETYKTQELTVWRKVNLTTAKRICRQKDDSFIPATVKIQQFTSVYLMEIDEFVKHAKQLNIYQTGTAQ